METGCLFLCLEVRKSNVFEAVKQAVLTRQAAEFYGIQVGRNGIACCPFYDDKHPSMKVDRRFHCFGCQADGDVIDFTARLFRLNKKEAALKLAEDFSVSFDAKDHDPPRRRPVRRKISEELRYRQAEQKCFRVLCDYLHLLERWEKEYAPQNPDEAWNSLFVEALQKKAHTEYLLDILLSGSMEELAAQAMKDADAFYQRFSSRMERRYLVDASQTEKERKRLEARNQEIDGMFLSLYTDKAKGILTEQRFMKLTAALEQEQEANQKRLHDLSMMQSRADA